MILCFSWAKTAVFFVTERCDWTHFGPTGRPIRASIRTCGVTGVAAEGEACDDKQEESIGIGRIGSAGASSKIDHELNRSLIIQSRIILITRVLVHPLTFDRPAQ